MAKTEEELLKMSFMQLRNHCKSLDIDVKLGGTKGSMIKMILAKDPPTVKPKSSEPSKEDQIKSSLTDTAIYNGNASEEKKSSSINIIAFNEDGYKDNTISLDEARKIVKRYCPRRGQMGMTIYPGFLSIFRAPEFKKLSISEFMNNIIIGNESILGLENMKSLHTMLNYWDDISNNNGWNLCIQHLNGFIPNIKKCTKEEALMFSIFLIPDIIPKMRLLIKIFDERLQALDLLYFMDTFNSAMIEIENNDIYSKIFLSSILLSKFRNEDVKLNSSSKYKNVVDFLQKVAVQPSAKELFQSKRWNTLKKKGKLVDEINKPQLILSDADFNKIRAKAIKFGSAIQPQMPRVLRSEIDKKTKQDNVKKEIGSIDTKALQSKLQNALKNKLGSNSNSASIPPKPPTNESKDDNDNDDQDQDEKDDEKNTENDDNDIDLTKYRKMLSMRVPLDAVIHEMTANGISKIIIEQFVAELNNTKNNDDNVADTTYNKPAVRPRMPNALLNAIGNSGGAAPIPASAPLPNANGGILWSYLHQYSYTLFFCILTHELIIIYI